MFFLYQFILSLVLLISPLIIFIRILKNKEDRNRFTEKFCIFKKKRGNGKLIWFHGASVGEILSIIPIVEKYEKRKSVKKILITSSTLSSSKVLKKFKFKKTIHQFYPIDHFFFTNKFLNHWKPSLAIFVDSEIWPSMFKKLNYNKIPLVLLNSRITKKSFKKWSIFKEFTYSVFKNISFAYPQNSETKFYLKKLGVKNIRFIGNLKFIENPYEKYEFINNNLSTQFRNNKVWIASSIHPGEEIFCAKTHIEIKKKNKNIITIIIPRHVDRTDKIISNIKKLNLNVSKHSSRDKISKDIDIYIVDTFGETKKFYKISSIVFMGKSLPGSTRGGQNPLEPARYGATILHGPNVDNFKDIYRLLKKLRISKKVTSPKKMVSIINFKKNNRNYIRINKIGEIILKKTIRELNNLINNEFKKT